MQKHSWVLRIFKQDVTYYQIPQIEILNHAFGGKPYTLYPHMKLQRNGFDFIF